MEITTTRDTVFYNITTPSSANVSIHSSEYYHLQAVRNFLWQYYIWIIFAFGFPGNLLSLFVVVRMSRHHWTTSLLYVALLAVVDNTAIILKIIENQTSYNRVPMASGSCKILYFLGLTLVAYANWILIIMSAERFTAVIQPLKVALIWSLKRAVIIIVVVLVFLCLVHLHIFFTISSIDNTCRNKKEYASFYYPWWYFISSSVYAIIPAIVITLFNILIIIFLRKSSNQRRNLLCKTDRSNMESRRQERQVTIMLVTLAIVFISLTIPRCILVSMWSFWKPVDDIGSIRKSFLDALTSSIADSNHAVNFYLYFVSGRRFRNYFLELFHCEPKRYQEVSNGNTQTSDIPVVDSGV